MKRSPEQHLIHPEAAPFPFKRSGRQILKLPPQRPFLTVCPREFDCDMRFPVQAPQVQIIASKRVIQVGEPFDVKVIAGAIYGLRALWWFGENTGISDLDKAHWKDLAGGDYFSTRQLYAGRQQP